MQWVTMKRFKRRKDFDYHGMKDKLKKSYTHVHMIEDIWDKCKTYEIVRRLDYNWFRLE